jgi:hypothetical protein
MANITGLIKGEFGKTIVITLQKDGMAVDISTYTTILVKLAHDNKLFLSKPALFVTNGADGQISFSFSEGDLSESGKWELQVDLLRTGELTKSDIETFEIGNSIN